MKKKKETVKYSGLRLPVGLIEELKLWKQAASNAAMRPVTYAEFFRGMLDSLDVTKPDITEEMDRLLKTQEQIWTPIHWEKSLANVLGLYFQLGDY